MSKTLLVIKHEFITSVSKLSFWLTTIVFPFLIVALSVGPQLLGTRAIEKKSLQDVRDVMSAQMQTLFTKPSGYVDYAGIIQSLPASLPEDWFIRYKDEAQAKADLQAQKIARYYVIAADYVQSGNVTLVTPGDDLLTGANARQVFTFILNYNLLHDEKRAVYLVSTMPRLRTETLEAQQPGKEVSPATYMVPMGMMILLLMLISMSSGFMLRSVSEEKQNRVIEMLLLSVSPRKLMFGKLIGLGLVSLLQLVIWLSAIVGMTHGSLSSHLSMLDLSPSLLVWVGVYFLLGYLVYAAEMGVIGTLTPSARESGGVTFLVLLPLLIPMWLGNVLLEAPNGIPSVVMSLFPLSAPLAMPIRMTLVQVPLWQSLGAVVGLAVTAYLFIWLAARFFRADTLLSMQSLNLKRLRQVWRSEN